MKRNPDCFVTRHSGEVESTDNPLGEGRPDGTGVVGWEGGVDRLQNFEGEGVLDLKSCEGQSGCLSGLKRVEGVWVGGKLEGAAVLIVPGEYTEVVYMVGGVKHGVGLVYLDRERKYLARVILYKNGEKEGPDWDLTMGQGLDVSKHMQPTTPTVGTLTPTSHWGGGALYNKTVWFYPRYKVVMTGVWVGGVMVEGTESKLERVRCREGLMEVETRNTSSMIQTFDPPNMEQICSHPNKEVKMKGFVEFSICSILSRILTRRQVLACNIQGKVQCYYSCVYSYHSQIIPLPLRRSENDFFDLFNLPHPGKYVVRLG